jgi:hypothetical protein
LLWVNRFIGLALIALAIPLWQISERFPGDARYFPRVILISIAVLASLMVLRSFVPAASPPAEGEGERTPSALIKPLLAFGVVLVAVVMLPIIGFFPAMALLGVALYPLLQVRSWKAYACAWLVTLVFVYVLFVLFLNVPLTSVRLVRL